MIREIGTKYSNLYLEKKKLEKLASPILENSIFHIFPLGWLHLGSVDYHFLLQACSIMLIYHAKVQLVPLQIPGVGTTTQGLAHF